MLFKRVDTLFVPVRNADLSQEWYANVLKLEMTSKSGDGKYVGFRLPTDDSSKTGITLVQTATFRKVERAYFNFFVASNDVETVHQKLKEDGVAVTTIQRRGDMRIFSMVDPDGNKIGICSWEEGK